MKVYNYDRNTKEYINESIAMLDRVTSLKLGYEVYLTPANATFKAPLPEKEGYGVIFNGYEWEYVEDHRGETVYRLTDRTSKVVTDLGPIPSGYVSRLPEFIEEVRAEYLHNIKELFNDRIKNYQVAIPGLDVEFTYNDLETLKKEKELGVLASRDANNKIYNFTINDYNTAIKYLFVYGQYLYLLKWEKEAYVKSFKDLNLLKKYETNITFDVPLSTINNLVRMPEDKRDEYFIRLSKSINSIINK